VAREPEWLTAQRKALGVRLREGRHAEGHTQAGFARSLGLGRYERTSIAHIESGSQSAPREFWECADELLNAGGDLVAAFDALEKARVASHRPFHNKRAAPAAPSPASASSWTTNLGDALIATVSSWQRPASSAAVVPADAAALQWLLEAAPADHPVRTHGRRIGVGEVAGLRVMRAHLKEIDNSLGGGAALPIALAYLRRQVPTLLNCQYSEQVGRALMSAVAELTLDLGWMAYDCGLHADARRQMLYALRLSHAAGNRLFGGRVLAAMCHQALHLGNVHEAVALGRAASDGTIGLAPPAAVAMVATMEACAHAAGGEAARCARALTVAERALDRDGGDGELPDWLDFDRGGLAGHAARAWRDLRRVKEADEFARYAVAHCRPGHGRTLAQRRSILATTLLLAGDLDGAVVVAGQIVDDAEQMQSGHVRAEVLALARVLARRKTRVCADLLDRVDELRLRWPAADFPVDW
jgi:transcriptional regulator with XRE-family HTH domain